MPAVIAGHTRLAALRDWLANNGAVPSDQIHTAIVTWERWKFPNGDEVSFVISSDPPVPK